MAKEKEDKIDLSAASSLSAADILTLVSALQNQNASVLAEALAKLSPTYQSPEQKAFSEQARESQRNQQIAMIKNTRRRQRQCGHEEGQQGRTRSGNGAFFGLKLPTGETVGVCCYCQAVISSANPDHHKYFQKINGTVAEAGQVGGLNDPVKAQLARLGPDERARVIEARAKYFATAPKENELDDDGAF